MPSITITSTLLITLFTMSACSSKPVDVHSDSHRYKVNEKKNMKYIADAYSDYQSYKTHKAMAVTIDSAGRAALGYSFDCTTTQSAKRIALENCEKSRQKSKATSACTLFAVGNKVLHINK
ncbi:MAG: Unknown protein [uncultured Sulfurovum sp.]|uniref:DUF4189 domain-containing protein n=1 Tax=uncultured Sulfurovum sp. TaxID=269237 RepID=A0A6S6S254_9BACT|nr:MAG: Unknown protein [uncultured Sulfurovum sp.]